MNGLSKSLLSIIVTVPDLTPSSHQQPKAEIYHRHFVWPYMLADRPLTMSIMFYRQ
jgi:hypothetical protein